MTMSSNMSFPHINLLISASLSLVTPPHHTSQQTRNKKEDTIHDTKGKTGFKHRARFINFNTHTINISVAECAKIDVVTGGAGERWTVVVGDEAELVDACDKGSYETEIDEGDEEGVGARAVVGEEGCDGPGAGEHWDDEEY